MGRLTVRQGSGGGQRAQVLNRALTQTIRIKIGGSQCSRDFQRRPVRHVEEEAVLLDGDIAAVQDPASVVVKQDATYALKLVIFARGSVCPRECDKIFCPLPAC